MGCAWRGGDDGDDARRLPALAAFVAGRYGDYFAVAGDRAEVWRECLWGIALVGIRLVLFVSAE